MTANDLAAMRHHLGYEPGDDDARMIYADALEDDGRPGAAAVQRAIAGMRLGLYADMGGTERSDIRSAFAGHYEAPSGAYDAADGVWVREGFDLELLVGTYTVGDEQISEGPYVICSTRGDLTLAELRRLVVGA